MSVKDRDHGRIRIVCTVSRESGTCSNRRPYYLDGIEKAVVEGLKSRLGDREAIERYIRTYNAERQRLGADAIRNRSRLEARIQAAAAEEDRTITLMIKGILSEDRGVAALGPVRATLAQLRDELSRLDDAPVIVAMHPRAVDSYLASIDRLDEAIREGMTDGSGEAAKALREIVDTVVVNLPVAGEVSIDVSGKLNHLVGPKAFPNQRVQGGKMVAEERFDLTPLPFGFRSLVGGTRLIPRRRSA